MKKLLLHALIPLYLFSHEVPQTYGNFFAMGHDDFAWENDKVAFRVYGPVSRGSALDSGVDCWMKTVEYPIIDEWYRKIQLPGNSYHKDDGTGADIYHVGGSRGCGGLALWLNGKMHPSDTFTDWAILYRSQEKFIFQLIYRWKVKGDHFTEIRKVSIELGSHCYVAHSQFLKNGVIAPNLPIAIGLTTHESRAKAVFDKDQGYVATWDSYDEWSLGTGIKVEPKNFISFKLIESDIKDASHALLITQTDSQGSLVYASGYSWEKAGHFKSLAEWESYLASFLVADR